MDLNKTGTPNSPRSAVLVLHELLTDSLILTKRSEQLRHHPGELCFPGGVSDPEDATLYETALRELHEELGISSSRIHFIKAMDVEHTLMGLTIHPWYATIDQIEPYVLNNDEVTSIISIPINLVLDISNYKEVIIERYGYKFSSCEFTPTKNLVWGATARIMKQLAATSMRGVK
ncbi:MAG: CoA pyrophosphatase [Legionella sp.]|nr:CoA pyrophosphatase [Legionella sp.]